jgi:hypothetical protein
LTQSVILRITALKIYKGITAKEMYGKMKKGTVTKKEVYKFIDSEMFKVPKNKR